MPAGGAGDPEGGAAGRRQGAAGKGGQGRGSGEEGQEVEQGEEGEGTPELEWCECVDGVREHSIATRALSICVSWHREALSGEQEKAAPGRRVRTRLFGSTSLARTSSARPPRRLLLAPPRLCYSLSTSYPTCSVCCCPPAHVLEASLISPCAPPPQLPVDQPSPRALSILARHAAHGELL